MWIMEDKFLVIRLIDSNVAHNDMLVYSSYGLILYNINGPEGFEIL